MTPAFSRFFGVLSLILIVTGVSQVFVRPKNPDETLLQKLVNRATITALVSVAVGLTGLLLALGILQVPRF